MAPAIDWTACEPHQPYPGVRSRRSDTDGATLVRYEFAPGASYPQHSHPEEQVVVVLRGSVTFYAGDEVQRLAEGDLLPTPGGVPHRAVAGPEGAVFVNVVVPRRPPA